MVLAAQAGSIEPGAEAETVVLVRNTGAAADVFHVVVQGEAVATRRGASKKDAEQEAARAALEQLTGTARP